jgi:Ni/Co efflux regulator RcnB
MKIALWMMLLSIVSMLATNPACAEPPHGKGGGKQEDLERGNGKGKGKNRSDAGRQDNRERPGESSHDRSDARHVESPRPPSAVSRHFEDRHRGIVREYYVAEYRSGHCPPGLAKKNNGCMPPGQAKKWRTGQPLPRDVVFYDIPPALVVRIGTPPPGYRYVRVAADILLIAIGTGMVIDAITDLGNM